MRVTPEMKIKDVLEINEKMLDAFTWLAPEFNLLRNERLRRVMSGRITVSQAARVAKLPLTEALYVLNLSAGDAEEKISKELMLCPKEDFESPEEEEILKRAELIGVFDNDLNVHFVDVMPEVDREEDPMPKIVKSLTALKSRHDILLIRHPFDPVPLRDLFARKHGLTSWAEERSPGNWYIYFYRPG